MNQIAPITPVVRLLIIINVAVWLVLQMLVERFFLQSPWVSEYLSLIPSLLLQKFYIWQVFTYMFLHSSNVMHILFNMLMLWWLGGELEQRWGAKFFLTYYLVSGVGAAVIYAFGVLLYGAATGSLVAWNTPVVGASGAIFGLLLAYGIIFGERVVHFLMIFPMKARYFVMILGAMEFMNLLNSGIGGSDVATLAHLGGIASGYIFLKSYTFWKQGRNRKPNSKRGRGLKLVVNNDNKTKKDGPRYWN